MRRWTALCLASLALLAPAGAARADHGPVIVIPNRPGVPIVMYGRDVSYTVVEGDWGLARPGHGSITIIGHAPPVWDGGHSPAYYPRYGYAPPRGRNEIEPGPDRPLPEPAESYSRSWSTTEPARVDFYGVPRAPLSA